VWLDGVFLSFIVEIHIIVANIVIILVTLSNGCRGCSSGNSGSDRRSSEGISMICSGSMSRCGGGSRRCSFGSSGSSSRCGGIGYTMASDACVICQISPAGGLGIDNSAKWPKVEARWFQARSV